MNAVTSVQLEAIQEREERERQWNVLREVHNKCGFRNVESAVDDAAFEKGVKDGYVEHCNAAFVDGQWRGYHLLRSSLVHLCLANCIILCTVPK